MGIETHCQRLVTSRFLSLGTCPPPACSLWCRFASSIVDDSVGEEDGTPRHRSKRAFVDRMIVQARAGHGGHGCASVRRTRSRSRKVQPDGGNGGNGGDIVLKASKKVKSLVGLPQLLVSTSGEHGSSKRKHGKRGNDGVYLVPMGTHIRRYVERDNLQMKHTISNPFEKQGVLVAEEELEHSIPLYFDLEEECKEEETGKETSYMAVKDLIEDGDSIVVAKGGIGGQGNAGYLSWRHRRNQTCAFSSTFGESVRLELEMKLISDISLVGFPNVGKSSLLRKISSATPRVGSYAFTTVSPHLGRVSVGIDSFTVSDVPGLVQGAHENKGLGHRFLRHVERTNTIVYVLDAHGASAIAGNQQDAGVNPMLPPEEQFSRLRDELKKYSSGLMEKKFMIVLNKMDLVENGETFKENFLSWVVSQESMGAPLVAFVSATDTSTTNGIDMFIQKMKNVLEK